MYQIEKKHFISENATSIDRSYLIDIFRNFKALEDEDSFFLPDECVKELEDANISSEIYEYFILVYAIEEKDVNIEEIVGSHDMRNLYFKTWLENFIVNNNQSNLRKYCNSPTMIFSESSQKLSVFQRDGKYYVADGHHRFSTLYTHYCILKSRGLLPENFLVTIPSFVKVVPNNLAFVHRFVEFCEKNKLYYHDDEAVWGMFSIVDSNPDNPVLRYKDTDIVFDSNSDLEEVLASIKKVEGGMNL